MRQYSLFLVIFFIVVISGCAGQETVYSNDGLLINDFSAERSRVIEGTVFRLNLDIENVGGTTADNVVVDIYGASWVPELYKGYLTKWYDYGDIPWPGISLKPVDLKTMPPSPGGSITAEWELPAPDLPEGVVHPYELTARVTYDYSTSAVVSIPVISRSEYEKKLQRGEAIDSTIKITNSDGPIQIAVEGVAPVIIDEYDPLYPETIDTQSFRLIFQNLGSGVPYSGRVNPVTGFYENEDGLIYGTIRLDGPAFFDDCMGVSSGFVRNFYGGNFWTLSGLYASGDSLFGFYYRDIDTDAYMNRPTFINLDLFGNAVTSIKLKRGSQTEKSCRIAIDKLQWRERAQDVITMVFDLHYTYYTDAKTVITAVGRKNRVDVGLFMPALPPWVQPGMEWTYNYYVNGIPNPYWTSRFGAQYFDGHSYLWGIMLGRDRYKSFSSEGDVIGELDEFGIALG
jgi:hypothetical protein